MFTPLLRSPMPTGPNRLRISPRTGQSRLTVVVAGAGLTGTAVAAGSRGGRAALRAGGGAGTGEGGGGGGGVAPSGTKTPLGDGPVA